MYVLLIGDNVLVIGDIVGPDAVAYLAGRLPELRLAYDLDLVVANGENCAVTAPTPWTGFGMTLDLVDLLLQSGVDVVISGDHGWDGSEADAVHRHPRVLKPHNVPEGVAGKGVVTLEFGGERCRWSTSAALPPCPMPCSLTTRGWPPG